MHGLAAADKVLNSFRNEKKKWTKWCLYSICYIICIDYKYENGNNCYIFNTVVHNLFTVHSRVSFLLSIYHVFVQIVPALVWGDQYSQSHQLHHIIYSGSRWVSVLVFKGMEQSLMCNCEEIWLMKALYHWSVSILDWTALRHNTLFKWHPSFIQACDKVKICSM